MTLLIKDVKLSALEPQEQQDLLQAAAEQLGVDPMQIHGVRIRKKSLDARKKSSIVYVYQLFIDAVDEEGILAANQDKAEVAPEARTADPLAGLEKLKLPDVPPVIVGTGPAGIYAALVMVNAGLKPIILDRGEPVEKRLRTVNKLRNRGEFNPESNYCYGEGGAGTFSDGKLTCGRNHPLIDYIFRSWVEFGAPASILYEAHPHIGTDHLMIIAKRQREYLEERGAVFHFNQRFVDYRRGDKYKHIIVTDQGNEFETDHFVMAIGHSARETYAMLLEKGIAMEPKPFAIGARIEHPQDEINAIQFGSCDLGKAAEYKLAARVGTRGIWTFCMCPGGFLLPTGAQSEHLAINGMSYYNRASGFANAAVVVNVAREDYFKGHVLDGARFQQDIEKTAFRAGGSNYHTPAQRLNDFLARRDSKGELVSSYKPGVNNARLDQILPNFVVEALSGALHDYQKRMRGFLSNNALVAGVETKTSAPVVFPRDKSLQSLSHPGLFPTGEGAGYAGGIVSAALDGVRVGRALLESLQ